MAVYDQTKDKYLRNSCTIMSLLHIMKYNFWIQVEPSFIMKVAIFFDKLWVWFPEFGAYFSVIYKAFINELNKKLWLNFKLEKQYISTFKWDTRTWWVWVKNYSKLWKIAEDRWELKYYDIEMMRTYAWKTYFHNLVYDGSKWGYLINSAWKKPFKCKLSLLKQLQSDWFAYDPMRTIEPATNFTKLVTQITRQMARYEQQGNLDEYIARTPHNKAFEKAWLLYKYWRDDLN